MMLAAASAPVVVGVDASAESDRAVAWGAREAMLRQRPLHLVHAFVWPMLRAPLGPGPGAPVGAGLRAAAQAVVSDALERARLWEPDVEVSGEVVTGMPAPVLVEASQRAVLVVVGSRGLSGLPELLLGSVGAQLSAHAACPVAVVRPGGSTPDRPAGPVVVGTDGSTHSTAALWLAFEEADLRLLPLIALHTWTAPASRAPGDILPLVYDVAEVAAEESRLLAETIAGWRGRYPDVPVTERVEHAHARRTLVEASRGATLLVVGSRGWGGFPGLLLGSVSHHVLHHAYCPTVVARPSATHPPHTMTEQA